MAQRKITLEKSHFANIPQSLWFLVAFLFGLIVMSTPAVFASGAEVALTWDPPPGSGANIKGYKVYWGYSSHRYETAEDVGNQTTCTFTGLEAGVTYYFAATTVDLSNNESSLSDEVVYTVPTNVILTSTLDTDNDGLGDFWEIDYFGTDPNNPDTDGDGVSDGEEVNIYGTSPLKGDTDDDGLPDWYELDFWGESWYADDDGDGLVNVVDADSDGDGYSDGIEVEAGTDPADPDPLSVLTGSNALPSGEAIWIEAEDGYLQAPMQTFSDPKASGGMYVKVPKGFKSGYADYTFQISSPRDFAIWGRGLAYNNGTNSFYVSIDGNQDKAWHLPVSITWEWDLIDVVHFDSGGHNLEVFYREKETMLDQILITDDLSFVPIN